MKENLRSLIREEVSKLFENWEDDYISSFEYEDIPDMQPGGEAHKSFLRDLEKEPEMGTYKEPTEQELENIIQGLQQANLELPSDQELINQAEEDMQRKLNNSEIEKIKRTKKRMEKIAGAGTFNESQTI